MDAVKIKQLVKALPQYATPGDIKRGRIENGERIACLLTELEKNVKYNISTSPREAMQ